MGQWGILISCINMLPMYCLCMLCWDFYLLSMCPSVPSATGIAEKLLQSNTDDLDVTSMQIRQICRKDLGALALSGQLVPGTRLQHVMTALNNMAQADTQSIESANSIVRIISTRCRKISLELLSSRLLIKYALGAYSKLQKANEESLQPHSQSASGQRTVNQVRQKIERGESLHAAMVPFAQAFQHDTSVERWAPPPLADFGVTQNQVILAHPFLKIKSSDEWASSYATALRQTLCPRKKKQHHDDDNTGQSGKITKATAAAKTPTSSSASVNVADGQSHAPGHSGPSGDVRDARDIGWPIVKMSLEESNSLTDHTTGAPAIGTVASASPPSSSRWFLWIGNYRYTMSFIEVYTDYDTKGGTYFVCKLDEVVLDAATIFASYFDAIQKGASLQVERLMLHPDSMCVQSVAAGSGEPSLKLALVPEGSTEVALTRLFTATSTLHVCSQQALTRRKTTKAAESILGTAKRKRSTNDGDHHDDDDDPRDIATRAAEELHGDIDDCPPDFSDEDEDSHQLKEDTDIVMSNDVSKIKQAVNKGSCPPAKAIKQVSEIISKWPQFSDLPPEDREEQALIMIITGVSKKDDEVSTVDVTSPQDDAASTSTGLHNEDDIKQDHDLPSTLLFNERNATKSMGPASLPAGKDYCKSKGIYLSSAASSSYKEWCQSVLLTAKAFQLQYKHGKDAVSENISLVMMPSRGGGHERTAQLVWVHWLKHQSGSVRQVALDAMGRVIFSLAWAYPAIKLQGTDAVANTIILPDAGVPMMKVRSQERPLVPEDVRRLHDVLKAILHIASSQDTDSLCCEDLSQKVNESIEYWLL